MAKNKNRRQAVSSPGVSVAEKIPLVSVIIPMYNAEKYISQTLESLLYQTMQDFEVVVVDDCSTDNSIAVVEGFAEKFGGRLHVIKLPENSGTPGTPRNVGIQFARGKYIAFLDSDDLFTKTALEEFTTLAEEFQADVVHTDGFFLLEDNEFKDMPIEEFLNTKNYPVVFCNPNSPRLKNPTLVIDDFAERMNLWLNSEFHWATWATFCKKDFLIVNQIYFPLISVTDDVPFNFACLCLAKKIVRLPNINYIYRLHSDSVTSSNKNLEKVFHRWISNLNSGFNELKKIMSRFKFFGEHPDYCYAVLDWFFEKVIQQGRQIVAAYTQIHPAALNQLVQKEFHPDDAAFATYLFNTVNIQRLQIMQLQAELRKFQQQ